MPRQSPNPRPCFASCAGCVLTISPNVALRGDAIVAGYGPRPVASRPAFDVGQDLRIGEQLGFHLGQRQLVHTLNGKSFPDTQPILVREGQYVKLRFINETDEYHPMHPHGHFFSVLSKNGKPLSGSQSGNFPD
jgi:FtsP/CotA-like multicopper oxidase with cupredoxin domain